jgi:hypothetical protein
MTQDLLEIGVFLLVFVAVWVIYEMGGGEEIPGRKLGRVFQLQQYSPAVSVVLEYRSKQGVALKLPVKIARSFYYPDGRVCLRGYDHPFGIKPKSYRVDNIISVATPGGEYIDRRLFLTDVLKIPAHLLPKAPLRSVIPPLAPAA